MSLTQRVRDYLQEHPGAGHTEVARALSISYAQAKDCRTRILRPRPEPRAEVSTLMVRGDGDRRHDCSEYEECLTGAAHAYPQGASCPRRCARYQERDHSVDVAIGALVARESRPGGLGEAEGWADE